MKEFEEKCMKEAKKILKNLDFKIEKITDYNEKERTTSILLKDKNSNFECWFDIWVDSYDGELTGDWNKYIFNLDNSKDLIQKYVQEDAEAFENAFFTALEFENYI